MDTNEISTYMKCNRLTRKYFRGVYSIDNIPKKLFRRTPFCIIVNSDPSFLPGMHWLACWIDKTPNCVEFFDSFGQKPHLYTNFPDYFAKYSNCLTINKIKLQSEQSAVCGHFCLVFLYCRSLGISLNTFKKIFNRKDRPKNDQKILKLFKHFFLNTKINTINRQKCTRFVKTQTCCARHSR